MCSTLHDALRILCLSPLLFTLAACGPPSRGEPQARAVEVRGEGVAQAGTRVTRPKASVAPAATAATRTAPAGSVAASERALEAVAGDPSATTRRVAIDALDDEPGSDDALLRALTCDDDPVVRRWAALALERRAQPRLAPALRQAVTSEPDRSVRNILERALQRAGG